MLLWSSLTSTSFDFLIPDLYIEPSVSLLKHPSSAHPLLREYVNQSGVPIDIAIIGPPGSGKTTAFRNIVITTEDVPSLYLTAKDIVESKITTPTIEAIIREKYNLDINWALYTNSIVYIDGVDEVGKEGLEKLFRFLTSLQNKSIHYWIAVRSDFFFRYIVHDINKYSLFSEVLELSDWLPEQGLGFIKDYATKAGKHYIIENVFQLLKKNKGYEHFLIRPFKASLLLFLLTNPSYDLRRISDNDFVLYCEFYEQWVSQEINRAHLSRDYEETLEVHMNVALELYINRTSCRLEQIFSHELIKNDIFNNPVILGLLDYRIKFSSIIVEKFQHETLTEFLVAYRIIKRFLSGNIENILSCMEPVYDYDVNLFVRKAFESLGIQKKKSVVLNLTNAYNYCLENLPDNEYYQRIREQIIYYIGRVPQTEHLSINVLKRAYREETNSILMRSAVLSLILLGIEDVERDYLEKMLDNPDLDLENRSIQLVYFGDVQADFHTYKDDGIVNWDNTKKEIITRLAGTSKRDINLRLWDLVTLLSFCRSRSYNSITETDSEIIKNTLIEYPGISEQRKASLQKTKGTLLDFLKGLGVRRE